ncbi:MAG: hypothetical protein HY304_04725 [candidate division Zixibacteria bacterium]|nr:hypothetical protein [candidate division Zixibacteria bacterium]
MATAEIKVGGRDKTAASKKKADVLPFTRTNYYIFLAGLVAIILGYVTLGQGSITLAPILLVLGYCVIVPVAILYKKKDDAPPVPAKPGD